MGITLQNYANNTCLLYSLPGSEFKLPYTKSNCSILKGVHISSCSIFANGKLGETIMRQKVHSVLTFSSFQIGEKASKGSDSLGLGQPERTF